MRGIRLVIEEFHSDVTKTRGTGGAMRIDYGDPRKPEKPIQWLWRFVDAARTPSELFGRCLVVIASEQYASRLVLPSSQQHSPIRWSSHKDHARKALAKLIAPHLPATLKQLEKAIERAHAEHHKATARTTNRAGKTTTASVDPKPEMEQAGVVEDLDDEEPDAVDALEDELVDVAGAIGPDGSVHSDADPGL
jgi:hypothetical protein